MAPNTLFVRLSSALTGESSLDKRFAGELEQRIKSPFAVTSLLAAFEAPGLPTNPEEAARAALGDNEGHHRVAREIIRIWYTGQFETRHEGFDAPRTSEQWERGLLWRVLAAPAPGFSKNSYGVWANKPS
jgi:hypothetical protein